MIPSEVGQGDTLEQYALLDLVNALREKPVNEIRREDLLELLKFPSGPVTFLHLVPIVGKEGRKRTLIEYVRSQVSKNYRWYGADKKQTLEEICEEVEDHIESKVIGEAIVKGTGIGGTIAFVKTAVRNFCISKFKKLTNHPLPSQFVQLGQAAGDEEDEEELDVADGIDHRRLVAQKIMQEETDEILRRWIREELKPEEIHLIQCVMVLGLPIEEIAKLIGRHSNTVKYRMGKLKKKLEMLAKAEGLSLNDFSFNL